MKFTVWDIETDTSGGFGLDPNNGGIISIAASVFSLADAGEGALEEVRHFYGTVDSHSDEAGLLTAFHDWMHTFAPLGPLVGWNSTCFDAPFVARRCKILGVKTHLSLTFDPSITPKYEPTPGYDGGYRHRWCEGDSFDLAFDVYDKQWCETNGVVYSLKPVAEHFGLTPVSVDRERIHQLSDDELRAYNLSDVRITAELFARHIRWRHRSDRLRSEVKALEDMFFRIAAIVDEHEMAARRSTSIEHSLAIQTAASHLRDAMSALTVSIRKTQHDLIETKEAA